ncbi:Abc transporter g family member [Thalictrum thalictroides]|uniref:Abc transporter g family member n=1 Tax=Thalictrum thalictroides TaxID=46969 RepID=A0A7J6W8C9_THATH|nr:Abc transporter g family member [Thalictrum thalictroides]
MNIGCSDPWMTLLLGPPGSGKSTLLKALAGKLDRNLQWPQRLRFYNDITVRETFDFAARFQGASDGFAGYLTDLTRLEKERNI